MKYLIYISFFLVIASGYAQQSSRPKNLPKYDSKPLHFGFTLGINSMDFSIKHSNSFLTANDSIDKIECTRQFGFNISIVSSLRLGEYFDLRFLPGLSFGQRDLSYSYWSAGQGVFKTKTMKIESTFLNFPFLLKYKAKRIDNYRPYLIGGASFALDLASQKSIKEEEKPKVRLKPFDVYYEFGFGIDYYLTYFKFSTEIKYTVGMFDILRGDETKYTSSIDKMTSNILFICFHFE